MRAAVIKVNDWKIAKINKKDFVYFVLVIISSIPLLHNTPVYGQNRSAIPNPSDFAIGIYSLGRRVSSPADNGFLELGFINKSNNETGILLSAVLCSASCDEEKKKGENLKQLFGYPRGSRGGDFARLNYIWVSSEKEPVISGTCELSSNGMRIAKHSYENLRVAIKIPSSLGRYKLSIHFDNRNLENIACTNSDFYDDEYSFFQADTEQIIDIN